MILLPGALSQREERRSELSFSWDARDCSLRALSGQVGTLANLTPTGTTPGNITPLYGPVIEGAKVQPRFCRVGAENVLELSGVTSLQDQEKLTFPYALHLHDLTVYMKLTGLWTAGASLSTHYIFGLGTGTTGGGQLRVFRTGTNWRVERKTGTTVTADLAENAGLVWPVEMLASYTASTRVSTIKLRGANGTVYGPSTTAAGGTATGRFLGDLLGVGSDPLVGAGAAIRLYRMKIALALYDFDAMTQAA
jgi:hypothetical protein